MREAPGTSCDFSTACQMVKIKETVRVDLKTASLQ